MTLNFSLGNVYGIDSIFEFLIIIVSLIIAYSAYKIYKILGDKITKAPNIAKKYCFTNKIRLKRIGEIKKKIKRIVPKEAVVSIAKKRLSP